MSCKRKLCGSVGHRGVPREFILKSDLQSKLDKEKKEEAARRRLCCTFIWNIMTRILPCGKFKTHFSGTVLNPAGKQSFSKIESVRVPHIGITSIACSVSTTAGLLVGYKLRPPAQLLLQKSNFKPTTSFGFLSPNYTGQCT